MASSSREGSPSSSFLLFLFLSSLLMDFALAYFCDKVLGASWKEKHFHNLNVLLEVVKRGGGGRVDFILDLELVPVCLLVSITALLWILSPLVLVLLDLLLAPSGLQSRLGFPIVPARSRPAFLPARLLSDCVEEGEEARKRNTSRSRSRKYVEETSSLKKRFLDTEMCEIEALQERFPPSVALKESGWVPSEQDYFRYLKAFDSDLRECEEQMKRHSKWRRENKPEAVTPQDMPVAWKQGCFRMCGFAKSGHPILLVDLEKWFPAEYPSKQEVSKYMIYMMERVGALSDRVCKEGHGSIYMIFDLHNWSALHNSDMACIQIMVQIGQNEYPNRLHKVHIIRAPWMFSAVWSVIKPWLHERTKQKIDVIGGDWEARLLEMVHEDLLEVDKGGNLPVGWYPPNGICPVPRKDGGVDKGD